MNTPILFTPVRLGAIEALKRIAMAPLTRMRAGADRIPHNVNGRVLCATRRSTVHFELWGRLQSAEGFSPAPANHETPAAGGLKAAAA